MKPLLILFILIASLCAYTYENQMMQTYAKITPRLVLMTTRSRPIQNKTINIAVLYEEGDRKAARRMAELMQNAYPEGLENHLLNIQITPYSQVHSLKNTALFFLLESDAETIQPIIDLAKQKQILTVAYSSRHLANGAAVSLYIGKTVKPYLNIKAAQESSIAFDNLLIKISKIYHAEEE